MPQSLDDSHRAVTRRRWATPAVTELPALEQLTLQTGGPGIVGSCTPGGGCNFSLIRTVTQSGNLPG